MSPTNSTCFWDKCDGLASTTVEPLSPSLLVGTVCFCWFVQLWFSHVLRDAFAAQAAGLFRSFKDVGAYHLEVLLRQAGKDAR